MAPIDLTRVRGPVNRRALRKYAEFWAALHAVGAALEQAEKFAQKAADAQPVTATRGARSHWTVARRMRCGRRRRRPTGRCG